MTKKQALKAIIFVCLFLFMLKSVTYMIRTNGNVKEAFVGFYAEPEDTIDVVMIGSSPVYPFYAAPQMWGEYGFTAYPLSSNVQRPRAGVYLVKEALKTQTPDLFVFELRMYAYTDAELTDNMAYTRGVTDNLKYSWNRFELINELVENPAERYTYYFDIFKYHSNWKTIVLPEQFTALFYERLHPLKGYMIQDEVVPGEGVDFSSITDTMPIPPEQEETLRELLVYLQENDLEALFIVSPMVLNEELCMKFNYMENIVTSSGYTYLDLNDYVDEIGIDFAMDYYDGGSHTNASGAEKCTAFLGEYISSNYELEDKRGNEDYSSWDEAYIYWQEEQQSALEKITEQAADR
ncbi:MAG: SGNH/GDSL hydrolase family protein [Lachnospiraceae bacterium]|nr:SGNH/GDSL hydrolase family protein [Lachnospiraceae bacterium]